MTVVRHDDLEETGPRRTLRVSIDTSSEWPCYELVLEHPTAGDPGSGQADRVAHRVTEKSLLPFHSTLDI